MTSTSLDSTLARPAAGGGRLLRLALRLDAAVTGAFGALLALTSPLVDGPLGISSPLLLVLGVLLLAYAAVVELVARRPRPTLVWGVILANVAWVGASIAVLLAHVLTPTTLGTAVVVAQALAVALVAELQHLALRRS
jgi:hypothetical protein